MILHLITNFSPQGGAENSLRRFVAACPQHRHTVVSLMGMPETQKAQLAEHGANGYSLGITSAVQMLTGAVAFSRQIARLRPEIIICWMYHANYFGTLAAKLSRTRVPIFWNVRHSLEDITSESVSTRVAITVNRLMSHAATGIIYCSHRAQLQHEAYGYASHKSIHIPNGYVFPPLCPRKTSKRDGRVVIGAAGRLHSAKDYPTMLAAIARVLAVHPGAEFLLAGNGVSAEEPKFAAMMRDAGVSGDRVRAIGHVTDMTAFYRELDLFLLSSRTEAFPNVLAEAMGHGLPCVTTDVGDAAEIVADYGRVVPAKSPQLLADALLELLAMPEQERCALGKRAHESVANRYAISRVMGLYLSFFGL
jgi:glycosyltransferase involved in cell wall biosynthesis